MRAVLAIFAFASSVLSTAPVLADDNDAGGLYVGIGLGDFSTGIDDISDVDAANLEFDSDETARKIFAGWRFNRFMALQIDRVDFERSVDARNALNVVSTRAEGFAPSVVGTLPIGPLEIFARGGILWYDLAIDRKPDAARATFVATFDGAPRKVGALEAMLPRSAKVRFEMNLVPEEGRWKVAWAGWSLVSEGTTP